MNQQAQPTTANWLAKDAYMEGNRAWEASHSKKIHITLEMKCSSRLAYPIFVQRMASAYGGRFAHHEMVTRTMYLVELQFITEAGASQFAALVGKLPTTHHIQHYGMLHGEA